MNFDNILSSIKLNCEYKYVSFNIDNYAGNINTIKNDLNKYILKKKTVILCVDNINTLNRIVSYLDDINIFKVDEGNIIIGSVNIIIKNIVSGFIYDDYVVISLNDLFKNSEVRKKYNNKFKFSFEENFEFNLEAYNDYTIAKHQYELEF